MVILCRTQGRNLADFMFREKSNVAIRILDNIAVEAAGLAYKELRFCSQKLRKERLWTSFSSSPTGSKHPTPLRESMDEMLRLSRVLPLSLPQLNGHNLTDGLPELAMLLGDESGIDWSICCKCMRRDKRVFSPYWSFDSPPRPPPTQNHHYEHQEQPELPTTTHLFYMREEDLFLLLQVSSSPSSSSPSTNTAASATIITSTATGKLVSANIVEKDDVASCDRQRMALQKFANFLLHYIWQNL